MARQGRFGRLPRSAPSITNTIVAIEREMQAQDDRNIMDAWKNGGLYKGAPVTDDMVLGHWRDRLALISKKDPLYDTYSNAVMQYEYAIEESKITTAYSQGKIGEQAVADFYLNWAKKVPQDSEFYRTLQRDAAQYIRAVKAKSASSTRATSQSHYSAQQDAIDNNDVALGQYALYLVTMLAQHGSGGRGAVLGSTAVTGPGTILTTSNIGKLDLPGVDDVIALLKTVTPSEEGVSYANPAVLFHDENGRPITGTDIVNALKAADPSFNGTFDLNYVTSLINRQKEGLKQQIELARKTGHIQDATSLTSKLTKVTEFGNQISAWPVMQQYADLKDELDKVMRDNSLLPAAKLAAIDRIRAAIGRLADDPRIASDDHLISQLRGEASGTEGTVTVAEDMTGVKAGYTSEQTAKNSEVANINSIRALLDEQVTATQDPGSGMAMTQGDYVSDGVGGVKFVPSPGGKAIGAAPIAEINNLPSAGPAITVLVPNGDGGGATPMMLVPAPVTATARRADGTTVSITSQAPVATFVKYMVNGVEVTLYGLKDKATGIMRWTTDPPWDTTAIKSRETTGGLVLDLTAVVPQSDTTGPDGGSLGNGFIVIDKRPVTPSSDGSPGKLAMDPAAAALATDPARQHAGPDPNTDSFSPTLVALKATPDGQTLLRQYASDPRFQQIIDYDAHVAAGMTYDAATDSWRGSEAQMVAYARLTMQGQKTLTDAANPGGSAPIGLGEPDYWQRHNTATQTQGALSPVSPLVGQEESMLPTDNLRTRGDEKFAPLYDAIVPGTNRLSPATAYEDRMTIEAPTTLVVPQNPFIAPGASSLVTPPAPESTFIPPIESPTPQPAPAPAPVPTYNAPPTTAYETPSAPTSSEFDSGAATYTPGGRVGF